MRIIELNANIVHILPNKHHERGKLVSHERGFFIFIIFCPRREGLRAGKHNFNLKIHKLNISK